MLTFALTAFPELSGAHWGISHTGNTPYPRQLVPEGVTWVLVELEDDQGSCVRVPMLPEQAKMMAAILQEYAQKAEAVQ